MSKYESFAAYYDSLTENVDYCSIAGYIDSLIREHGNGGRILLDLACGTGSLSFELAGLGYDVAAADSSEQMLSAAMNKPHEQGNPIFLLQSMQELDLFGTIDAAICTLDSINHLTSEKDIIKVFERVALFLNDWGLFIFDVNTLHKHRDVLANNAFVYDTGDVYCVWQNSFCESNGSVEIDLDFFEPRPDGSYIRSEESFSEYYFSDRFLVSAAEKSGMECIMRFDGFSRNPVNEKTERTLYVCRRIRR